MGICVSLWDPHGGSVGPYGGPYGGSMGLCVPMGDLCVPMCLLVSLHTAGDWKSMSTVGLCKPGHSMILWVSLRPCAGSMFPYGSL